MPAYPTKECRAFLRKLYSRVFWARKEFKLFKIFETFEILFPIVCMLNIVNHENIKLITPCDKNSSIDKSFLNVSWMEMWYVICHLKQKGIQERFFFFGKEASYASRLLCLPVVIGFMMLPQCITCMEATGDVYCFPEHELVAKKSVSIPPC